eukprot:Lankesteria_metandrocarpae@DN6396_c0_g1_i1.p1
MVLAASTNVSTAAAGTVSIAVSGIEQGIPMRVQQPSAVRCFVCGSSFGALTECMTPDCTVKMHAVCLRFWIGENEKRGNSSFMTCIKLHVSNRCTHAQPASPPGDGSVYIRESGIRTGSPSELLSGGDLKVYCPDHAPPHRYCVCGQTFDNASVEAAFMIGCDSCGDWLHGTCVGRGPESSAYIDLYQCRRCAAQRRHLVDLDVEWCSPVPKDDVLAARRYLQLRLSNMDTTANCDSTNTEYRSTGNTLGGGSMIHSTALKTGTSIQRDPSVAAYPLAVGWNIRVIPAHIADSVPFTDLLLYAAVCNTRLAVCLMSIRLFFINTTTSNKRIHPPIRTPIAISAVTVDTERITVLQISVLTNFHNC